jgi:hypothetical protein
MGSFWYWITTNWAPLGIGTFMVAAVTAAFGIFKWVSASRTDLTAKRQSDRDERLDERVLVALSNPSMQRQSRGMTGAGFPLSRESEIAFHMQENPNAVHASLSRLRQRGKAAYKDGSWFPLPD